MQADAYAGYNDLYAPARKPGPVIEAGCWAHARRKFFELAELAKAPLAVEAVRRIDPIFAIERDINGTVPEQRRFARAEQSELLVDELEAWMRQTRLNLSRQNDAGRAMDYMLQRWPSFTGFLEDGRRVWLTNIAAERALHGIAAGRKAWRFAGSDRGGERAAAIYCLIVTARLNDVDPRAFLADVLARIGDHPASRLNDLLPWNWISAVSAPAA